MSVPKRLLKLLDARDGHACAWHGESCGTDVLIPQHRSNRGMGGRKSGDRIENLVWLCSRLNDLIESNAEYAGMAQQLGIKISSHADPLLCPMRMGGFDYWLTADGRRVLVGWEPNF